MNDIARALAFGPLGMLGGCALIFGHPMTEGEFVLANDKCKLDGATLVVGNFMTGRPSIIEAARGVKPGDWDAKLDCVAGLFGGDGVSKAPSNSFEFRFTN